ncbi:MAG: CoA transferase [Sphingomonadales bacterium]|nr:CoA transferase [Sphingomonadales bacterium]MBU3993939.1 CoA transferase [Alphaproteobacteria bacterium]
MDSKTQASPSGPLAGVRVLDLSRVLAGPWSTQILGDLGAEVIKVEQPGAGDDTRRWGPPDIPDGSGDSAYYACANRNKRSIAIDIASPEGSALIRRLVAQADIVVENFRVGGLAKYGLDYASLAAIKPDLIYCSVTGFGQDGPYANRGGYDVLAQGMSGLMSVTGRPDDEPGGGPMKVGIAISDLSTGLYAAISILAALNHRNRTGEGQQIDCALLDTQVALLINQASNYLNGGVEPRRLGNEHPNMVVYRDFACADGDVLVALGNERQYRQFVEMIGRPDLATDPRFAENSGRIINRAALLAELFPVIARWKSADLLAAMDEAGLPAGRINTIPEALANPQIVARGLVNQLPRADGTPVHFLGYPAKFSATPPTYRLAPPRTGEHTRAVLHERLGLGDGELDALVAAGTIAGLPE